MSQYKNNNWEQLVAREKKIPFENSLSVASGTHDDISIFTLWQPYVTPWQLPATSHFLQVRVTSTQRVSHTLWRVHVHPAQ